MSSRYDAFEERLVNLEDKLVALQEQVNNNLKIHKSVKLYIKILILFHFLENEKINNIIIFVIISIVLYVTSEETQGRVAS